MPVHKYFCPECGLVLQSDTDVANQSVECRGCQAVFVAQPMNRPSAAESAVLRAPAPPHRKPKTDVPKPVQAPTTAPAPSVARPADPPVQRPSVVRNPDPPTPAPAPMPAPRVESPPADSPPAEPPRRKTSPPPPPPPPPRPSSKSSVKLKRPAAPAEEDEEIISLAPVRKKKRWPLVVGLLGVVFLLAAGGVAVLWFFVLSGDPMKHRIEAPDKAWAFKLPDAPTTSDVKDENKEYAYSRPGKDAEYTVNVNEGKEAAPEELFDTAAQTMFAAAAMKYNLDKAAVEASKVDSSKYNGQYTRRLYEIDSGSRGKLAVQLIVVTWNPNQTTTIIQVAIGKDISDSERKAFFNSVEIRKASR